MVQWRKLMFVNLSPPNKSSSDVTSTNEKFSA